MAKNKNQTMYWIVGVVVVVAAFWIFSNYEKPEEGFFDIELYDADKNLIEPTNTMAVVNSVPGVQYIKLSGKIENTGDIDLNSVQLFLSGFPDALLSGLNIKNCDSRVDGSGISCPNYVGLDVGDVWRFEGDLVNVDEMATGSYELTSAVKGVYSIEGSPSEGVVTAESSIELTLAPDFTPDKTAGISVDISTGSLSDPCSYICPHDSFTLDKSGGGSTPVIDVNGRVYDLNNFMVDNYLCLSSDVRLLSQPVYYSGTHKYRCFPDDDSIIGPFSVDPSQEEFSTGFLCVEKPRAICLIGGDE